MPKLIHTLVFWLGILNVALSAPAQAQPRAKLAIIIDDIGYNLPLGQRTINLTGAFTLAVLPFTPHGSELAELAHKQGKELMLHAPMSNHANYPLGRGGLVSGMARAEFLKVLRQNLANIPYIKGVNNHMGSQLTEQAEPMRWLMQELQARQLYFVDSRTTVRTQALIEAERINLPSRRRDVFLDDQRNRAHIENQLLLALAKASQQGAAIAIGHPYPETLAVLNNIQPLLAHYNVQLVPVSHLMSGFNTKAPKIDYCPAPPSHFWPEIRMPIDPFDEQLLSRSTNFAINVSKI